MTHTKPILTSVPSAREPAPCADPDPHGELWQEAFDALQALVTLTYRLAEEAPLRREPLLRAALRGAVLEAAIELLRARRSDAPLGFETPRRALRALRDLHLVLTLAERARALCPGDHARLEALRRRASVALRQLQAEALLARAA